MTTLPNNLRAVLALALLLLGAAAPSSAQTSSRSTSSSSRSTTSSAISSRGTSGGASGNSGYSSTGARQYRSNTLLGDALIQVDAESRSVVVVTDEETHASIAKVIANLDHPKPQVLIKVVFVEVTLDKDFDVGLEGNYSIKTSGSGTVALKSLFGMASALSSGSDGAYATLNSSSLTATLHALSSSGKAKVLSRPSIMARNNQEAVIVVGQEVPIVTNSQITDQGNTINTIKYQDVGIILRVTPFISSDKTVEMIVAPEISSLSNQTVAVSTNVNVPVINKRSAETVVVTPNATTVVIGGLMQKQDSSTVQKIPLLGDIPLLGLPFRRTVKSETRSELLIFLTPYIVENTASLTRLTVNEANRAELSRDCLSPDDIRNNLDTLRLMPQLDPNGPVTVQTQTIVDTAPVPTPKPASKQPAKAIPTPPPSPTPKAKAQN
ncbi:MAG: hypothetical protein WCH57_10585 [Verrucomicrobiota bacterium]